MMHVSQTTIRWEGPNVTINCPRCNGTDVAGTTYDEQIEETIFFFIPINRLKYHRVVCSQCRANMTSSIELAELARLPPSETSFYLKHDPGLIPKFLAVTAVFLAIFPALGTIFAAIALGANSQYRGWSRTLSMVALAISFVPIVLIIGVYLYVNLIGPQ